MHPYPQLQGGQAQFVADDGQAVRVNAWRHDVADYVNAVREAEGGGVPRLLVLRALS